MATKRDKSALATEAYINGANPLTGGEVNANLENGEYVKFPEGSIAEVLGNRHSNGGVDLSLPEYTQVLSNTKDLKITKEDVKKVKEMLDLKNVSTKNTYSDVIDKYARKIGYKDILKDQEELFKKAEKYVFNVDDKTTANYNRQTYAKKIQESEGTRKAKEKELSSVFDVLFNLQEDQKGTPKEDREVPEEVVEQQMVEEMNNSIQQTEQGVQSMGIEQPQSEFSEDEIFKYGGQIKEIENISRGMGVPSRTVFEKLRKQGKIKELTEEQRKALPKFDTGGTFRISGASSEGDGTRVKQSPNSSAFGEVQAVEAMNELYRNFPQILSKVDYKDIFEIKGGKVVIKEGVKLNKKTDKMKSLQKDIDTQMKATANYALKPENIDMFDDESLAFLENYLKEDTFVEEEGSIRGFDGALGNFTGTRYSPKLNIVTSEEAEALASQGITTIQQLQNASPEVRAALSAPTLANLDRIGTLPEGVDFGITANGIVEEPTTTEPSTESTVPNMLGETTRTTGEQAPRMFFEPGLGLIPPKGLQAEGLYTSNFSRLDPLRVGIEPQLKMINDTTTRTNRLANDLPQAQRAALAATTLATSQQTEADMITKAAMSNAASQSQVDQYNNSQADREMQSNNAARQNYEARMLRGLDNTENDVRDYYAAMQAGRYSNLNRQMQLNTLDRMFPDIRVDNFGISGRYDPKNPLHIEAYNKYANAIGLTTPTTK